MHRLCPLCGEVITAAEFGRHKRARGDLRGTRAWRRLRAQVLARDGRRCVVCGAAEGLEIHHVDGDPRNNAPGNLKTVCRACHGPDIRGGSGGARFVGRHRSPQRSCAIHVGRDDEPDLSDRSTEGSWVTRGAVNHGSGGRADTLRPSREKNRSKIVIE